MSSKQWEAFFAAEAPNYHSEPFTQGTAGEVEFLIREMPLRPGMTLLDIGCGTGRHGVELARRGIHVTGMDQSDAMLALARQAAAAAGVSVEFVQADATRYQPPRQFDAVTCLCEGAFCLLEPEEDSIEHDLSILRTVALALRPGGRFLLTALSASRMIRAIGQGGAAGAFDLHTMVQAETIELPTSDGPKRFHTRERGYVPTELRLLCRLAGLEVERVAGGTAGRWGWRPLDPDEYEIMILARKPSPPVP